MKEIIINIAFQALEDRKKRCEKALNLEIPDRVPVLNYIGSRHWLPIIGYKEKIRDYLHDPLIMLEAQLHGAKWILENIKSDMHQIVLYPDFMWVEDVQSFGSEVVYSNNDSPWVSRPHLLQENDNLDIIRNVDYSNSGLHKKMIEFYKEMKILSQDYTIRFSDGKVISANDCVYMGGGGIIGIATIAGDLCGVENLSLAFYDKPQWVKELLNIIAEKSIEWIKETRKYNNGKLAFCSDFNKDIIHVGDDGIAQMSIKQVDEFIKEPLKKISEYIHSSGLKAQGHNCGKADHLLDFWMNDIEIDRYYGFSYMTDKELIKKTMGGKIPVIGGIDTIKLKDGTINEVKEDVKKNLDIFKECPGYILMDGHNVAPGTPIENINAIYDSAEKFGSF